MTELNCADCGAPMTLRSGRHGRYYGCTNYPRCHGHHGAHQKTGAPLGVPADMVTRKARVAAHMFFDKLWKSGEMSRIAAYGWLRTVLFLTREQAHISMLTKEQCDRLIAACKARGLTATPDVAERKKA